MKQIRLSSSTPEIQSLFNEIKTSPEAIFRYISDSCKFLSASKIQKLLSKHKFGSFSEAYIIKLVGLQISFRDFVRFIVPTD